VVGKHSEVEDSHDRYANTDMNCLLRRIEVFRGAVILTTNRTRRWTRAASRAILGSSATAP